MGSNFSIAAGETRGKRMGVTIPTTPKRVELYAGDFFPFLIDPPHLHFSEDQLA
ncbi:hypothetical protein [Algoriphagus boritolerans]|uniref:hypothetical protein n=1 Tax=Algoriphagus boritolerans TaxID=308111 RepID=UPI000A714861